MISVTHYQNEFNQYQNDIRDNEMISIIEIEQTKYLSFILYKYNFGTFFMYSDK